jgi:membrane peptidoglycan carboxypeptidase
LTNFEGFVTVTLSNYIYMSQHKPDIITVEANPNPGKPGPETPTVDLNPIDPSSKPSTQPDKKPNWLAKQKAKFDQTRLGKFLAAHKREVRLTLILGAILLVLGGAGVSVWAINIWNNQSSIADLGKVPTQSSIVYAKDGNTELFRFFDEENRQVVNLDQISPNMQQAIIALEDENFWYNETGIPWTNILGATVKCGISRGDTCRGGSGLSQQLIKNVKKDNESSVDRKVRELFTAIKLNGAKTKPEILSDYLNWVPFGRNAYGVQQAATTYFGKDAKDLDVVESCYLSSLVQRPSYFNSGIGKPDSPAFKELQDRKNACLQKIFDKNLNPAESKPINSAEDLDKFKNQEVVFKPLGANVKYPHFRDYVSQEIGKFLDEQELLTGGYKIITTLDPQLQDAAEKAVAGAKAKDITPAGANNAGVVALDGPTGGIVAMVGSLDYGNEEIDGQYNITTATRQPGSSIKPYVFASAFQNGLNPGSMLFDGQTAFEPGFTPKNFSGSFSGPVSARYSLANSLNIPSVKAAYLSADGNSPQAAQGINAVFDTAESMGLRFPCVPATDGNKCKDPATAANAYQSRCGISASLGGCEVNMLSHATGYNTLAQDGKLRTATPFKQILAPDGRDIYSIRQESDPVYAQKDSAVDPRIARQVNSILSDYEARRPVFGASARRLELAGWSGANSVAAKTGTTNDVKDTWTVGYSPYYTVAVWVGNTDSKPLKQTATSVGTTSGIWNETMVALHQDKEKKGFSKEGLIATKIKAQTGLPAEDGDRTEYLTREQLDKVNQANANMAKSDYNPVGNSFFQNGTTVISRKLKINKVDGKLAVEGKTLPENIEEQEFSQIVAEYPKWQETADKFMEGNDKFKKAPTENSDQDQVAEQTKGPLVTSNLDTNTVKANKIQVTATPQGDGTKTIASIEILINGSSKLLVEAKNTASLTDLSDLPETGNTVLIKAVDSLGGKTEKNYSSVSFSSVADSAPIANADISGLNVACVKSGTNTAECSFTLPSGKSLPSSFRVRIGSTAGNNGTSCSQTGDTDEVVCNGVSLPLTTPGTVPIQARVSGSFVDTSGTYENSVI